MRISTVFIQVAILVWLLYMWRKEGKNQWVFLSGMQASFMVCYFIVVAAYWLFAIK